MFRLKDKYVYVVKINGMIGGVFSGYRKASEWITKLPYHGDPAYTITIDPYILDYRTREKTVKYWKASDV